MALTKHHRRALNLAARRTGVPAETIHPATTRLLLAAGLITEHDHSDDGTWVLKTTDAGRALINPVEFKRAPVRLMHGARMPHPDPAHRGTVPEPELVDPISMQRYATLSRAKHRQTNERAVRSIARHMHTTVNAAADLDLTAPLADIKRALDEIHRMNAEAAAIDDDEHQAA